jgi:hypothetical protein
MARSGVRVLSAAIAAFAGFTAADVAAACAPSAGDRVFGGGFDQYALTINNYLAWCSVSENGGSPSSLATIVNSFADYTAVALHGAPVSGIFVWGYWTNTDVAGNDTNQDALVTMCSDRSVQVCCPLPPSTTCP